MGRDAAKAGENICFQCRKDAAKYNDRLGSREGAAEMLGISVSSLADYELGITKVIPVDKIVLMAELYNAPELKVWYCSQECPIGKTCSMLPNSAIGSMERTTLRMLRLLRHDEVESVTNILMDIMADGAVTEDEKLDLAEIMKFIDELVKAAGELRIIGEKVMNGGMADGERKRTAGNPAERIRD